MADNEAFAATMYPDRAPAGDALAARPAADALALRTSDPLDADYRQNIAERRQLMNERSQNAAARERAVAPLRQEQMQMLRRPMPQPPQQQAAPPVPQRNEPAADEAWLMAASVLGALAGGLTRNHTTNALAAVTGAMEGWNEGNKQRFDQELKRWNAENSKILETNKAATDRYLQILQSNKLALEQKSQELQLAAAQYDDRATMQLAQMKDLDGIGRSIEAQVKHRDQIEHWAAQLRQQKAASDQREQIAREKMQVQRELATIKRGVGGDNPLSDATIKYMAEQYLAGDNSVFTNLGRGAQGAENIIRLRNKIAEMGGEQGQSGGMQAIRNAEYQGLKSSERALGTREANIGTAIIEANKFAANALAASEKLPRDNFVPWNELKQRAQSAFSNPDLAQFKAYTNSFLQAYTRAVQGSGTVTVDARRHADEMISTAMSVPAYRAVIQALQAEMRSAQQAPRELREMIRTNELSFLGAEVSQDRTSPAAGSQPSMLDAVRSKLPPGWTAEPVQ